VIEAEVKSGCSLSGAYLEEASLHGNWFNTGADLSGADLRLANLRGVRLSYGRLRGANLAFANLEHASLGDVDLTDCVLTRAKLFNAKFRNNDFSRVRGLQKDCFMDKGHSLSPKCRMLEDYPDQAEPMYRGLVAYFVAQGALDDASWAAYRGRLMNHTLLRRKLNFRTCQIDALVDMQFVGTPVDARTLFEFGVSTWLQNALEFFKSWLYWVIFGYGEKPLRVALLSLAVIFLYAAIYALFHALDESGFTTALYFSIVTFTTLGYGDLKPLNNFRLVACSEAMIGLLLSGLFLFTLARRSVGRG
jgi:hypothetical protein